MTRRNTPTDSGREQSEPGSPKISLPQAKAGKPRRAPLTKRAVPGLSPEERYQLIAEAAYFLAERRGFAAGGELDDWLQAEAEVARRTAGGGGSAGG